MQFLPSFKTDLFTEAVTAAAGVSSVSKRGASSDKTTTFGASVTGPNAFLESLNKELAEKGVTPIVDVSVSDKRPRGFRTLPRGVGEKLTGEDISYITDKLRKKGVKDTALDAIEDMLASGTVPTLGNLMGMAVNTSRASEALSDQEAQELGGALRKMQFSQEEIDELQGLMDEGNTFQAMQKISKRLGEMGKEGFTLMKGELNSLMRGLDISEEAMEKIRSLFGSGESAELDAEALNTMLRPAAEELTRKKESFERMAGEIREVIDDALQAKKVRETVAPVADMRGSKQTERAETRMRDDLTAKANGFGRNPREAALEDEENALADEQADHEHASREQRGAEDGKAFAERRAASLFDTAAKSASQTEKAPAKARDSVSSLFSRFDVSANVTAPAGNVPFQGTATAQTHRQEIFAQVERGLLSQTQDGSHKMTLQLDPADLGRISLMLSVKGGEVRAVIRAENPETTAVLSEQMQQLRASLEEQGLKVAHIDIETQLQEDTTGNRQWADTSTFNQEQEMREQARFTQLAKMRREAGTSLAQDVQSRGIREEISDTGLHIIA